MTLLSIWAAWHVLANEPIVVIPLKDAVYSGSLATILPLSQSSSLTGKSSSGHGSAAANGKPLVSALMNLATLVSRRF